MPSASANSTRSIEVTATCNGSSTDWAYWGRLMPWRSMAARLARSRSRVAASTSGAAGSAGMVRETGSARQLNPSASLPASSSTSPEKIVLSVTGTWAVLGHDQAQDAAQLVLQFER